MQQQWQQQPETATEDKVTFATVGLVEKYFFIQKVLTNLTKYVRGMKLESVNSKQ